MKMTKALALLLAIAMVVVCFNLPAFCGGGGDDLPWDNDGVGSIGDRVGSINPEADTTTVTDPDNPTEDDDDDYVGPGIIFNLQLIISYQIIPNFNLIIIDNE